MSWDIFAQDLPRDVETAEDIPDDFVPRPLGKRSHIIAAIREAVPDVDFADPALGKIKGKGFSIDVSLGEDEEVTGVGFHVYGGGRAPEIIDKVLRRLGVRALDPGSSSGFFESGESARRSFESWQRYRNSVSGDVPGIKTRPRSVLMWMAVLIALVMPVAVFIVLEQSTDPAECLAVGHRALRISAPWYPVVVGVLVFVRYRSVVMASVLLLGTLIALFVLSNSVITLVHATARGKQMDTMEAMQLVSVAITKYREVNGEYPSTLREASAQTLDGWSRELLYEVKGDSFGLRSPGACGLFEKETAWDYPDGTTNRLVDDLVIRDGRFVVLPDD